MYGELHLKSDVDRFVEKMKKCQHLKREIGRLWELKLVKVVSVGALGALGSVTKEFDEWIEKLGITNNVEVMQKSALRTTRILRKVMEM